MDLSHDVGRLDVGERGPGGHAPRLSRAVQDLYPAALQLRAGAAIQEHGTAGCQTLDYILTHSFPPFPQVLTLGDRVRPRYVPLKQRRYSG